MPDAPERWFCEGVELTEGWVREVASYEGLFISPTLLATDISIPMRDGEVAGRTRLSPGGFTLSLWIAGSDRSQVERNWEHLLRVMVKRHSLVMFERRRPDGTARQCFGRVVGRMAPTPIGRLGMRAQVEVVVPSGTWQDTLGDADTGPLAVMSNGPLIPVRWDDPKPGHVLMEDQVPERDPYGGALTAFVADGTATYTAGWVLHPTGHTFSRTGPVPTGPIDRYVELPGFSGASAPMTRLVVDVSGPITGLAIMCPETGAWSTYNEPLTAAQTIRINGTDDIVQAPRVDAFRYKGPYMAEVMPRQEDYRLPIMQVTATQAGPGATIRVRGRRLYLTM